MNLPSAPVPGLRLVGTEPGTPFVDGYLAYLLARASRLISSEFHVTLAGQRIPVMHWRVLCSLYERPLPVTVLADIALTKVPTLSKLLHRMAAEQLIRRVADATDRRRVLVALTARGRRVVAPLIAQARAHEASVLQPFGERDRRTLIVVLQRLIALHAGRPG
jgi:MarR family transcriptional regulator, organic hydroperoxide resistance regulator